MGARWHHCTMHKLRGDEGLQVGPVGHRDGEWFRVFPDFPKWLRRFIEFLYIVV